MAFTTEQRDLQNAIRDFCRAECGTREQRENLTDPGDADHSTELYHRLAELGWLGIAIPEEYGGSGGTHLDQAILFEELYRGLAPVKAIGASTTVAGCYQRFGTDQQRKRVLGAIAGGTTMAISISEPQAGSDVANVSCGAKRVDGGFLINGQKTWCSYAHRAERILVLTRTDRDPTSRHAGLTLLDVPGRAAGVQTRRIGTMSASEVNDVFFTDCFVPEDAVVGEVGRGFQHIMAGLDGERLLGAAGAVGLAQRALDDAVVYLNAREQFGRAIADFQAVRHRLADLAIEVEASRLLTYGLARCLDDGQVTPGRRAQIAAMAKIKATETVKRVTLDCLQLMGGYGYSTEFEMESHVRHALVMPIYAGANEVLRDVVASTLGVGSR
jgi:alkylation response protein AidB-like acyl-CoA dehydrogenase